MIKADIYDEIHCRKIKHSVPTCKFDIVLCQYQTYNKQIRMSIDELMVEFTNRMIKYCIVYWYIFMRH
jgi:hypothetical protein